MSKSWLFLKNFQTSLLFSSESTLLLSAAWVVLQSKQSMFQRIFLKKSQFIVISDEKRQFSKHHFSQSRVSRVSLQTDSYSVAIKSYVMSFLTGNKFDRFIDSTNMKQNLINEFVHKFFGIQN